MDVTSAQSFTLAITGEQLRIYDNIDFTAADGIVLLITTTGDSVAFLNTTTFNISPTGAVVNPGPAAFSTGAASQQVNVNGPGTLQLSSAMTFADPTTISLASDAILSTSTDITVENIVIENGCSLTILSDTVNAAITGGGSISINTGALLEFNQITAGEYSGVILANGGDIAKLGSETLTLSGNSPDYDGNIQVGAGELSVTGSLAGANSITVNAATLSGNGTVGPIINSSGGVVQAGLVPGETLSASSYYPNGALGIRILIDGRGASKLAVESGAYIGNTLELDVGPGAYAKDVLFTVITGSIYGNFESLRAPADWIKNEGDTSVTVNPTTNQVITPVALNTLPTNPRKVAQYFFDQDEVAFATQDLQSVANASLVLSTGGPFEDSLIRLSPLTQAGSVSATFQNNVQMAIVLDRQFQQEAQNQSASTCNYLEYAQTQSGGFVQPIALFYNQNKTTDFLSTTNQVPFSASTYGAGAGYSYVVDRQFIFEGGLGFTHSKLNWSDNFGASEWNSFYVAPFVGWFNDHGFANLMFMWAANFYDTNRKIQFSGVDRTATSNYNSYDFLLRANGGFQVLVRKVFWFRPELTLNYLADVREDYTETGAGGISLQVKRKVTNILQPSFRARLVKEIETTKFCYAPNIYAGWLANIPLDSGLTSARFADAPSGLFFNIQGGNQTTNQLILGAEFFARRFDQFEVTANFEADLFSYLEVYTVKAKFEWMF